MATLKEDIVAAIKPCCRNKACAEQAADVAIKLVEEKFKPTNTPSKPCESFRSCRNPRKDDTCGAIHPMQCFM